jgi:hypothetical protein
MPQDDILRMLPQSPGWVLYREMIEERINSSFEIIKSKQLVDQDSVARHNVAIGKIQEMLDIVDA